MAGLTAATWTLDGRTVPPGAPAALPLPLKYLGPGRLASARGRQAFFIARPKKRAAEVTP